MPILNYTTKIDPHKTLTEIQQILASGGAEEVRIKNNSSKMPIALAFSITWNGGPVYFELPCNFEGVMASMRKSRKVPRNLCTEEQALRVGWRIVKDWIAAQIAIVEAGVSSMAEVFLPYAITKDGSTMFKLLEEKRSTFLLTDGK